MPPGSYQIVKELEMMHKGPILNRKRRRYVWEPEEIYAGIFLFCALIVAFAMSLRGKAIIEWVFG